MLVILRNMEWYIYNFISTKRLPIIEERVCGLKSQKTTSIILEMLLLCFLIR